MASRVISTKLAIEGESEYRASISRINTEIKTFESSLKLTESTFRNNSNTMEALTSKGKALEDLYEAQRKKVSELQAALENARNTEEKYRTEKARLQEQIRKNNEELETLKKTTGDTSEEEKRLTDENEKLNGQLQLCEGYLGASEKGVNSWQQQLNRAEIQLNDLDAEIKLNNEYLEEAKNSSDGCATSIDRFGERVSSAKDQTSALLQVLGSMGLVKAFQETVKALGNCVNSSTEFESAMAGVAKTTDLSEAELSDMSDAIQEMATRIPATTTEIGGVVEAAGQLGIAKGDLLDFAEVMVNLGTATNLSSEEAASALAKFANVVKMAPQDYDRLGSTIVALGNNFATTEADIVSMATRLSSTGSIVGLSEAQIMAIATALSSVGIEAEAGGSAISKLLKQMETAVQTYGTATDVIQSTGHSLRDLQMMASLDSTSFKGVAESVNLTTTELKKFMSSADQLESFAEVSGMAADEFIQAWGTDAVGALSSFINGLGAIDEAGGSSVATLNEMGITEVRLSNAVQALASSHGILDKALNTANSAWDENNALTKEAATRYETTESKFAMLANSANNVKIAIGDELTPALGNLAEAGSGALSWLADFIGEHEAVVPLVAAGAAGLGTLAAAVGGYTLVTEVAIPMITAFNTALSANPIGLIVLGITAGAAALATFSAFMQEDTVSVKELTTEAAEMNDVLASSEEAFRKSSENTEAVAAVADRYISRLEELEATGLKTDQQQKEYHNTLALLCQTVPELSQYIDLENDTIAGGTAALRANTEAWKENAIQQAYQEKYNEIIKQYSDVLVEAESNSIKLTDAEQRLQDAKKQEADILERMDTLWDEANGKAQEAAERYGGVADATAYLSDEYNSLAFQLDEVRAQQGEATRDMDKYSKAADTDAESVAKAEEQISLLDRTMESLTGTTEDGTEKLGENTAAVAENSEAVAVAAESEEEALARIQEDWYDAYETAYESLTGSIGILGEFQAELDESVDSVDEMVARWKEQTDAVAQYGENLSKAMDLHLNRGLVDSLSDGSAQSAAILQELISEIEKDGDSMAGSSEATVQRINESYSRMEEAETTTAGIIADIKSNYTSALDAMEERADSADFTGVPRNEQEQVGDVLPGKGMQHGEEYGGALQTGINNTASGLQRTTADLAGTVLTTWELTIADKPWRQGGALVTDTASGITDTEGRLIGTVNDLGSKTNRTMQKSGTKTASDYAKEFAKITGTTAASLAALKTTVAASTAGMPGSMQTVGANTIDGMIRGMNNRASSLYYTVSSIVNNSIARARSAAATASPSKKTTKIFEDVGDGMIVGLENRRKKIADTAQNVVDEALTLDVKGKIETVQSNIDDRMPIVAELFDGQRRSSEREQSASGATVRVELPIYVNGKFTRREIIEIAREGLSRSLTSQNAAKGVYV